MDPKPVTIMEQYVDGVWSPTEWKDLKDGMLFRQKEPDGTVMWRGTGHEVCRVHGDAYLGPYGCKTVSGERMMVWVVNSMPVGVDEHGCPLSVGKEKETCTA